MEVVQRDLNERDVPLIRSNTGTDASDVDGMMRGPPNDEIVGGDTEWSAGSAARSTADTTAGRGDEVELIENIDEIWKQLDELRLGGISSNEKALCSCGSDSWDRSNDVLTCSKCFTVLCKDLDAQAEWRFFGNNENGAGSNPSRCGLPINQFTPSSAMGTIIGNINSGKYFAYNKMRKYHLWNSMPYRERSLHSILNNINLHAGNSGLTQSIIDDAKVLYSKLAEDKITRGENRNGLIASTIYMSCKSNNVPRSAKEIAKMFNLNITTMTKGCKHFNEILKDVVFESSKPRDFMRRFLSKLKKSHLHDVCSFVVDKTEQYSLVTENAPPSIAAGIIYLVGVKKREPDLTKKIIAKNCDVSEVTINKCYKKLLEYDQYLFPP